MNNFNLLSRSKMLLLTLVAMLGVSNTAWAATLTENFDDVKRLDANGNEITSTWSYGYSLSNGWFVSPATNAISASKTMNYGIAAGGTTGNALWAGYGSSNSYYMVIPTMLQGEITFKACKNQTSTKTSSIKFFEVTESDGVYTVTNNQLGETATPTTASWGDYSINIGDEGKYIAIHMIYSGLDDFEAEIFEEGGTIAKPTALTVSDVTYNSAMFSWTAGGEESAWQLVYDTNKDFDKDAATPVEVTANPYTLTGLADGTTYYAYLRAKIDDEVSAWTPRVEFTTEEQYPKPTAFALTGYTATSATFSWTAGSTEEAWQISYSLDENFDPATATIVNATTNPFTIDNLTAEKTYYACIRADYGTGYSAWSEPISFKPSSIMNLLINDGTTTNGFIPVYGMYVDSEGTMSQFIIPAETLASMANREITKLTFYSSGNISWGAKYKVYLKETDETAFDGTTFDWTGMDEVADVTVNIVNGLMEIELDNAFAYSGSNLMVGFALSATGEYKTAQWLGVTTAENTARYSYKNYSGTPNAGTSKFLPKMTITSAPLTDGARMKVSTDALAFGKVTPETALEGKQQSFTIENKGTADLTGIVITSDNATYTIGDYATTLAQGAEPMTVVVTMDTETAGEHNATITVKANGQVDALISVTGIFANAAATMDVTLGEAAVGETVAYGTVNKETAKVFTVSNTGDLTLHITNISSNNETDFTVAPATLDVAPGETGEFAVTFVYNVDDIDLEKNATITLTATGLDSKSFTVTGTRSDIWSEDFEGDAPLNDWESDGFAIETQSGIGFNPVDLDSKAAVCSYNGVSTLITPKLKATVGDELSFDAFLYWGDEDNILIVEYSEDKTNWNTEAPLYAYVKDTYSDKSNNRITLTAPMTGSFYLRFTAKYSTAIDNIVGFKLASGSTTGISNVKPAKAENRYYDLSGRQVAHPTKGLYIVNGRTVVVK